MEEWVHSWLFKLMQLLAQEACASLITRGWEGSPRKDHGVLDTLLTVFLSTSSSLTKNG